MFKLKSKQKRRRNTSDDEENDQIDDDNIKIAEQIELTEVVIPNTDSPEKKNKKRTLFFDTYNGLIYRRKNNFLNESQLDSCDDTLERFENNYSNQPQGLFLF